MLNRLLKHGRSEAIYHADDGDVALKIRYVGAQASATVTVAAGGDITLKHGAAAAEVADTTINIGGTPGTIDVSDTDGDTLGEVADHINNSANWECYIVDAIRADSSNDTLLVRAETTITPKTQELDLYKDTSVALNIAARLGYRSQVANGTEEGARAGIVEIVSKNTFGSGTNTMQVYEVDERRKVETLVYSRAGAATTVEFSKDFVVDGMFAGLVSKPGFHYVVRMVGSAACTGYLEVAGRVARWK